VTNTTSTTAVTSFTPVAVRGVMSTSIGRKAVMAVTGVILVGYVIGHMTGNLLVFVGPDAINEYGHFLHTFLHGAGIWIARAILATSLVLHVWAATVLTIDNLSARPVGYRQWAGRESTYASRTMVWSGPILLLFVFYHIAHLTFGGPHPDFIEGDVYHNVVAGFRSPLASGIYIVSMLALGLHLYHGVWSMLQTLGLSHPKWNGLRFGFAAVTTIAVAAGNISIPLAVLLGILR
jgi:succinate dehydrogenase / fumarate reductase cytochrome b subunit